MSELADEDDPYTWVFGSSTNSVQQTPTACSIGDIIQALRLIPPEPIGEWMNAQGYSPKLWCLVLPSSVIDEVGAPEIWPDYVKFSPHLDKPMFVTRTRQPAVLA